MKKRSLSAAFVLAGVLAWAGSTARCLNEERTAVVVTSYNFGSRPVSVGEQLPMGTVLASTTIPRGAVITHCAGELHEGIWGPEGVDVRDRLISTNLAGIGLRVVSEKATAAEQMPFGALWRWDSASAVRRVTAGELRIELVKTGPIQSGILSRVAGEPQYRLYSGPRPYHRLVLKERLNYQGHLAIKVMGASPPPRGRRLT